MIATAAFLIANGIEIGLNGREEEENLSFFDLLIFMAFDLYMASLIAGVNLL